MYKIRAIVLSKQLIRDNQIRMILFTEEFGKITAWSKKVSDLCDIGVIVEVIVERKKQENRIQNIHTLFFPKNNGWNYQATLEFLTLLQIIKESLPEGMEQKELFQDIQELIQYISLSNRKEGGDNEKLVQLFILMKARCIKKQGYLREDMFRKESLLQIIYRRLDSASMKSMISSKSLSPGILNGIECAILHGIHMYKHKI